MIYEVDFKKTLEDAFLEYGAHVAQERSIIDVRDGLKLGLRQGLYAQFTHGLTSKNKFQKALKSLGAGMAQSYVHGDVSLYGALIRAAKPFAYRYPLEEAQGAYGTLADSDNHSAARYVELRSGKLADILFEGLKKGAVEEWYDNYDNTEKIPSVFPSLGFWNIVNGSMGIGVAIASSIPQFNLKEVNDALIKLVKDPTISYDEIYCPPDFATGCDIINMAEVKKSLEVGHGVSCRMRAKFQYDSNQHMITATNFPYSVYTNTILTQIAELTDENEDYGIERALDTEALYGSINIYLSKNVNPDTMIKKLCKDTSLEYHYSINMVMLDKGRFPRIFGWREACAAYLDHMREGQKNILNFELLKLKKRREILEGYLAALAHIDDIIIIIKSAANKERAKQDLIKQYSFTTPQAEAILELKLHRLTSLEYVKIKDDLKENLLEIDRLNHLLNDPSDFNNLLIEKLEAAASVYGDSRRSSLSNDKELIEEIEEISFRLRSYNTGIILCQDDKAFKKIARPKQTVAWENTFMTTNYESIALFTSLGRMFSKSLKDIQRDNFVRYEEIIELKPGERVILVDSYSSLKYRKHVLFMTKHGILKKSLIEILAIRGNRSTQVIKLTPNDAVVSVMFSNNEDDTVLIITEKGKIHSYQHKVVSSTGKLTKGSKGIVLKDNDTVVSAQILAKDAVYNGIFLIDKNSNLYELTNSVINNFLLGSSRTGSGELYCGMVTSLVIPVIEPNNSIIVSANGKERSYTTAQLREIIKNKEKITQTKLFSIIGG